MKMQKTCCSISALLQAFSLSNIITQYNHQYLKLKKLENRIEAIRRIVNILWLLVISVDDDGGHSLSLSPCVTAYAMVCPVVNLIILLSSSLTLRRNKLVCFAPDLSNVCSLLVTRIKVIGSTLVDSILTLEYYKRLEIIKETNTLAYFCRVWVKQKKSFMAMTQFF